jgi:hypothetical protein
VLLCTVDLFDHRGLISSYRDDSLSDRRATPLAKQVIEIGRAHSHESTCPTTDANGGQLTAIDHPSNCHRHDAKF